VRELTELGATPDDILARCANYRAAWPDIDLTVPALLKHWSRMEHPPPPRASPNGQPLDPLEAAFRPHHREEPARPGARDGEDQCRLTHSPGASGG
jgi:hypothetical protein